MRGSTLREPQRKRSDADATQLGERYLEIYPSTELCFSIERRGTLRGSSAMRTEVKQHGRHHSPGRCLASFGCATTDRIPTPLVPGRGDYGTVWRQCPTGRTALRMGTRDGREGTTRVSQGSALPGELRRAGPTAERGQGPAIGGRHPRDCGTPYVRGSGTPVVTSVHESVGRRGAWRLDQQGSPQSGVAQRAHSPRHPQPHELPSQADPEG